jgi:hypothetical protein
MEVSGQPHAPATLLPVPNGQKAEWAPEPVWTWRQRDKSLSLPGIELWSSGPCPVPISITLYYSEVLWRKTANICHLLSRFFERSLIYLDINWTFIPENLFGLCQSLNSSFIDWLLHLSPDRLILWAVEPITTQGYELIQKDTPLSNVSADIEARTPRCRVNSPTTATPSEHGLSCDIRRGVRRSSFSWVAYTWKRGVGSRGR